MKAVFADTSFWIALFLPSDTLHDGAVEAAGRLQDCPILTTEAVLVEFLNYFSGYGRQSRALAAQAVTGIFRDSWVTVVAFEQMKFKDAFTLFQARPDKGYSFTDCLSMVVMRHRRLTAVLTHDRHFRQEGFEILL